MFYFYFLFSLTASLLLLVSFYVKPPLKNPPVERFKLGSGQGRDQALAIPVRRKKNPLWAIVVVLFAPVTAPYFFIRANPESSPKARGVLTTVFYLCLFIVCAGEFYLFFQEKAHLAMARYSPVERQMIQLSEELMSSTIALDEAIKQLESRSKVLSKRMAVGEALSFIGIIRVTLITNKNDVERFLSFIHGYKERLEKEGFGDFHSIEDFFVNPIVKAYLKGLEDYLGEFKSLLNYTFDNFEGIDARNPLERKNYDVYYLNYRRAVDRYNRLCTQRIKFQRGLFEKHPGLERYLPTMIQTDFLKSCE